LELCRNGNFVAFLTDKKRRIRRNSLKLALINFCQKTDPP